MCVLVALGAYLLGPVAHRAGAARAIQPRLQVPPHRRPRKSRQARRRSSAGQPDIYQWLPFTQSGLAAAAPVVARFGDAYGTYSYTAAPAAYAASLQPVTSPQLVGQIEAAYAAPGVAAARASGKQVAVGMATIDSIRAFGPSSLTFLVQIAQQITAASRHRQHQRQYAVTLTGNGTSWQVTDVELATAGNS